MREARRFRRRTLVPLLVLVAAWLAGPAPRASGAPGDVPSSGLAGEGLRVMAEYFERHPELRGVRGSGWNPYQRIRWFTEPRLAHGEPPAALARWKVWQEAQRRAATVAPGATWFELGPVNLSGRLLDIEFDPVDASIVYVGSASGGLWKSTDGGGSWTPLTDALPTLAVGGIAVSPFDPDVVLIATGEGTLNADRVGGVGILKSTDGGATWNTTDLMYGPESGTGFHVLEVNPLTGTLLAGANDGLWRSTDEGDTWTRHVPVANSYFDVKWKPGDASRVYAAGDGDLFGGVKIRVSTDDGITWANLTTGLPSSGGNGKTKIAVTPGSPSTIYAHITSSSSFGTRGIYRSTDDGATWTARNTSRNIAGGQGWYNATIVVDPDDPERVIAGGIENWLSTNGGTTFSETGDGYGLGTATAVHWDHHAAAYEPGSTSNVWVGTDGGVWRSTDDGDTWASRREGIATYQFYDICVAQSDAAAILGGTQDNGVPGRDGPLTWFTSNLFADGMVCNVDPTDADVVYAESQFGNHVKSTDGGGSWFPIQNGVPTGAWVTPVDQDQADPDHLYTEGSNGIYRTTNGGSSWTRVATHSASWISISRADGDVVWTVEGTARPRHTTDDGAGWTTSASYGFPTGTATKIHAHPADAATAFVTFSGYGAGDAHVARTTDFGASWSDATGDLPSQPVNTLVVDPLFPDDWYIGTDVGVWKSTNEGASWLPFDAALPNVVVSDLEIRDTARKLVAGTYGRGAWEIDLPGGAVDATIVVAERPIRLMLDPPSPNPVRERTALRFAARHDGPVRLSVYDVQGRLVSPVAELDRGDGIVRLAPWLATDSPAGVYFAVLEAGEDRISRKIVVAH